MARDAVTSSRASAPSVALTGKQNGKDDRPHLELPKRGNNHRPGASFHAVTGAVMVVIPGRAHSASKTGVNALMGANPESIRPVVVMDFRFARYARASE